MTIRLTKTNDDSIPINVAKISPTRIEGLDARQIGEIPVHCGNHQVRLGDLFDVECLGTVSNEIEWFGRLANVHSIGATLQRGTIVVHGNAGRHAASHMSGGCLRVHGDVGDYVAAGMSGGLVQVSGNAANYAGGAYEHDSIGMRGGELLIDGSAGDCVGYRMRRGLLYVGGDCGDIAVNMRAGTIVVDGHPKSTVGQGMKRGTIVLGQRATLGSNFTFACQADTVILQLLLRQLDSRNLGKQSWRGGPMSVYNGDSNEGGRGEVWLLS